MAENGSAIPFSADGGISRTQSRGPARLPSPGPADHGGGGINSQTVLIILLVLFLVAMRKKSEKIRRVIARRKRKGVPKPMPTEMLKEFLGKECVISIAGGWDGAISGRILEQEDGWIKVETKKAVRMINLDCVKDISMRKDG